MNHCRTGIVIVFCALTLACGGKRVASGEAHDGDGNSLGGADDAAGSDTIGARRGGDTVGTAPADATGAKTDATVDVAADTSAQADLDTGPDAAPDAGPCPGSVPKADGSCCAAGESYDTTSLTCVVAGPAGCVGSAEACLPRWCLDWHDLTGAACDEKTAGCLPFGRVCSAAEVQAGKGCPAGQVPAPDGCVTAGASVELPPGANWVGESLEIPAYATAVTAQDLDVGAAPPALPPIAAPQWCSGIDGPEACANGCPVGASPDAGGICQPLQGVAWQCPAGFLAAAEPAAACSPDPTECGTDPFGGVQDGTGNVFIDASAIGVATGKRAAPFASVAAALPALTDGATLVLAAGAYATAIDTSKSLTVRGRCAAMVTLQGKAGSSVVRASGASVVTVQGVTISGGREPLRFDGPAQGSVQKVAISGGTRFGIFATGKAVVNVGDVFIHDMQPSTSDQTVGQGIHVSAGAHATLSHVRLSGNRDRGLYANGAGTLVTASGLYVDGTLAEAKSGDYGDGLSASSGAHVVVDGARLIGNHAVGVLAIGLGSAITLTECVIQNTQPQVSDGKIGRGVMVLSGASVDLRNAVVSANHSTGVMVDGAGSVFRGAAVRVDGTQPAADGGAGQGIDVEGGAHVTLEACRLTGNRSEGLVALGAGTTVQATSILIDGTLPRVKDNGSGAGLSITAGASATLLASRVSANRFAGLYTSGKDSNVTFGGTIDGTLAGQSSQTGGHGLLAEGAGVVTLVAARLSGNRKYGCYVNGGTKLSLDAVTIDNTLPQQSDGWGGRGLGAEGGPSLTLVDTIVWQNRDIGVFLAGTGTKAQLTNLLVAGTLPRADGNAGRGMTIRSGASAACTGCRFIGNRDVGLLVDGSGSSLAVAATLHVAGTLPRGDGKYGRGIQISGGGQMVATAADGPTVSSVGHAEAGLVVGGTGSALLGNGTDLRLDVRGNGGRGAVVQGGAKLRTGTVKLWRNHEVGLYVDGAGSAAIVAGLTVVETAGRGVEIERGGLLAVRGAVLARNEEFALLIAAKPSVAAVLGARIVQTAARADHAFGHGVDVLVGGTVALAGARLAGNHEAAIAVHGGQASIAGAWIAQTYSDLPSGGLAAGLVAAAAAQVQLGASRVDSQHGVGVLIDKASAELNANVVRAVDGIPGPAPVPADGVIGRMAVELHVIACWLSGNGRAGLLVDGTGAQVQATRIDSNPFGIVAQHGALVTQLAVLMEKNDKSLTLGGNLPLPAVPAIGQRLDPSPLVSP